MGGAGGEVTDWMGEVLLLIWGIIINMCFILENNKILEIAMLLIRTILSTDLWSILNDF